MRPFELIVIGTSLGGMKALDAVLGAIPEDFSVPIAVVQHRYRTSNEGLPAYLRRASQLPVVDVEDKQPIERGRVYLAPANYHLLVEEGQFDLSTDELVAWSRPSVDVLFDSAAEAYRERLVGVILTGANEDGARGVKKIKQHGGFVVVQDPKGAEAPSMPSAAIRATRVDRVLPLDRIGPFLVELCSLRTR